MLQKQIQRKVTPMYSFLTFFQWGFESKIFFTFMKKSLWRIKVFDTQNFIQFLLKFCLTLFFFSKLGAEFWYLLCKRKIDNKQLLKLMLVKCVISVTDRFPSASCIQPKCKNSLRDTGFKTTNYKMTLNCWDKGDNETLKSFCHSTGTKQCFR